MGLFKLEMHNWETTVEMELKQATRSSISFRLRFVSQVFSCRSSVDA